jgi:hypothetical protein
MSKRGPETDASDVQAAKRLHVSHDWTDDHLQMLQKVLFKQVKRAEAEQMFRDVKEAAFPDGNIQLANALDGWEDYNDIYSLFPSLEVLNRSALAVGHTPSGAEIRALSKHCKNIKTIVLGSLDLSKSNVIFHLRKYIPNLAELFLVGGTLDEDFLSDLQNLRHLKVLNFGQLLAGRNDLMIAIKKLENALPSAEIHGLTSDESDEESDEPAGASGTDGDYVQGSGDEEAGDDEDDADGEWRGEEDDGDYDEGEAAYSSGISDAGGVGLAYLYGDNISEDETEWQDDPTLARENDDNLELDDGEDA